MAYLRHEEGFIDLKAKEIQEILAWALPNSFYSSFRYYGTGSSIEFSNQKKNLTIEMDVERFRLNNSTIWSAWVSSYPLNAKTFNGPEEPAKGFLLTLLTEHLIERIEILDDGSLIFHFEKGYDVKIGGDDDLRSDSSWSIEIFITRTGRKIAGIMCSDNVLYGEAPADIQDIIADAAKPY
jgi:hypothetical protein